ncbi:MAG: molybdopterin-binding protein [Lachnospiraceae bacterium]|nr:molybdopterin-binding protein [Lachnospiraceae bacterium]
MKLMRTEEALGQVLCHDITQIIPGVSKGPVFRKGHIITEEDIPVLLKNGKDSVYIWEKDENMLHENEGAAVLFDLCKNAYISPSEVKEGKIEAIADIDGLFKVDVERLNRINSLGEMMISCRHGNFPVKAGDKLAGMRVIPLVIEKEKMEKAREVSAGSPILSLLPFIHKKVGILSTGNEVFHHRIEDSFTPAVEKKLKEYDTEIVAREVSPDDAETEISCIRRLLDAGADMILCTGGMSVDPDDKTPLAIRSVADRVVTYGAPVLPGAMFMLAYYEESSIPVMGLPGCVMYAKRTVFDLVLPRIMAGEILEKKDFDIMGEGGLCLNCPECVFPNCSFGK